MNRIHLRRARERMEITQVELAARSGLHHTTISALEVKAITNPAYQTVQSLRTALRLADDEELVFGPEPGDNAPASPIEVPEEASSR